MWLWAVILIVIGAVVAMQVMFDSWRLIESVILVLSSLFRVLLFVLVLQLVFLPLPLPHHIHIRFLLHLRLLGELLSYSAHPAHSNVDEICFNYHQTRIRKKMKPNQTKPNQTKPNQTKPNQTKTE